MRHAAALKQMTSKISAAKTDKKKKKQPHISFANLSCSRLSLLENEVSLYLLTEFAATFPQQQGAENSNDTQVEEEAQEERSHGPQEGRQHPLGDQRGFPGHHVAHDGLHLEVRAHHSADVEELVAVACQTKSRCIGKVHKPANTCSQLQDVGVISFVLASAPKSPPILLFCC